MHAFTYIHISDVYLSKYLVKVNIKAQENMVCCGGGKTLGGEMEARKM